MFKRDSAGSAARISTQSPSTNQLGMDHASVTKKMCFSFKIKDMKNFVHTCELK